MTLLSLSSRGISRDVDFVADIKPGQIRCGEHSDYGSLTLLFQDDVGGLEVNIISLLVHVTLVCDSMSPPPLWI